MFDKMKMWLMTEENRQKYIMEKEKAEREAKRNTSKDDLKEVSKNTKKSKEKSKPDKKSSGGLFGKKNVKPSVEDTYEDDISVDVENEELSIVEDKTPAKKIVVVKKKDDSHSKLYDELNGSSKKENDEIDIDDTALNKLDAFVNSKSDNISSLSEETTKDKQIKEDERIKEVERVEEANEMEEAHKFNSTNNNTIFADSPEEYKKMQMLNKKKEEEDKYFDIMLDLPPTTDMKYMIKRAFDAGVPEWFLRSHGYITDALDLSSISSKENLEDSIENDAVEKLKEQLKNENLDTSDSEILEAIEDVLIDEEYSFIEEINSEISEEEKFKNEISAPFETAEKVVEIDLNDVVDSVEAKDIELTSLIKESVEEKSVLSSLVEDEKARICETEKVNRDTEIKKKSSDLLKKLREKVTTPKESNSESSEGKKVLSDEEKLKLKLKARFALKEVVKESAETLLDKEAESKAKVNVEERLKSLKKKREVLTSKGNNILVKEDIEVDGKFISTYKSYNVSDDELSKIEVGKEVETSIEMVETGLVVDGEVYNLSEEEEAELIRKYSTREIWLLSTDESLLEKTYVNVSGSRYDVKLIRNEKDFIMAVRSVDNLIVFTKNIPKQVERSVAGFLKYLASEKRKARLVTIEESKVNSKIIEYTFDDLTVSNLDNYYKEYDYTLYREIRKPISELYKEISFDLSKELDNDTIEIDVLPNNNSEIVLSFDDEVLVDFATQKGENRFGDIELELDDVIVIDSNDLK